jgi:tRNA(fMet)-specific endonuclease VapC
LGTATRIQPAAYQAMKFLVDTDWIVDVLHGNQNASETLVELTPQGLAVSVISYGELFEGAYYAQDRTTARAGLSAFFIGKKLLPLTKPVMERFGIVRGQLPRTIRQQVGDMDLLIAATALHHDLTLLTRNIRDFHHIPHLKLYQPS